MNNQLFSSELYIRSSTTEVFSYLEIAPMFYFSQTNQQQNPQ